MKTTLLKDFNGIKTLRFDMLNYTQDNVGNTFTDGSSVRHGDRHLNDRIDVTIHDGKIWILSNRTAVSKQLHGHLTVECQFKDYKNCAKEFS